MKVISIPVQVAFGKEIRCIILIVLICISSINYIKRIYN